MKSIWVVLLAWALLIVESTVLKSWGWSVTRIDVTVVLVVYLALRASTLEGAFAAFACGYLLDVMGGQPTGLHPFLAMLTFIVGRVLGSLVEVRSVMSFGLFVVGADIGHMLLAAFFTWLTSTGGYTVSTGLSVLPLQVLLTGTEACLLYPLLRKLELGPERSRFGELR